jgi:DNA-binding transcriptional MocR family regulator
MIQSNGQTLPQQERTKPKRHNGKLCPLAIRQRIVHALANGDSMRSIARALHVSNNTVAEIRGQEWQQVEAAQQRIAAQWRQVATKAIDRMNDKLDQPAQIPLRELIPLAGVATDKIVALSRGSQLPDLHAHLHQHLHITEEQAREAARELIASRLTSASSATRGESATKGASR